METPSILSIGSRILKNTIVNWKVRNTIKRIIEYSTTIKSKKSILKQLKIKWIKTKKFNILKIRSNRKSEIQQFKKIINLKQKIFLKQLIFRLLKKAMIRKNYISNEVLISIRRNKTQKMVRYNMREIIIKRNNVSKFEK